MKKILLALGFCALLAVLIPLSHVAVLHSQAGLGQFGAVEFTPYTHPTGNCTQNFNELVVDKVYGYTYSCINGVWGAIGSPFTVGSQLTAAATLVLTNPVHHITSSAATVTTITAPFLPATGGCIRLIPDVAWAGTTTGGNIALGTTWVALRPLIECYDPVAKLFYPSY